MSKRPKEHVNETKSRVAFERSIPNEWVVNHQAIDYGVDCKVDVFKNCVLTKFSFYVQLKSKDNVSSVNKKLKYSFDTDRILDYMESILPVMLVVYDVLNDRLGYKWVEPIHKAEYEDIRKLKVQKSITMEFDEFLETRNMSQLYSEVVSESIKRKIIDDTSIICHLVIKSHKESEDIDIVRSVVKQWLRLISNENNMYISDVVDDDTEGILVVDNVFSIGSKSNHFFSISVEELNRTEKIMLAKILISVLLLLSGRLNTALDMVRDIIFTYKNELHAVEEMLCIPLIATAFSEQNREMEASRLTDILLQYKLLNAASIISTALINGNKKDYFCFQEYRRILGEIIKQTECMEHKGIYYYNLANNLRGSSYHRESILNYMRAIKNNPEYRNKSYWWREIAGCFYHINKYKWAYKSYQHAIYLGDSDTLLLALSADSLLLQGQISEANDILSSYLEKTKYPIAEYQLKKIMIEYIKHFSKSNSRSVNLALDYVEEAIKYDDNELKKKYLEYALEADPLCSFAWFNYSFLQSDVHQFLSFLTVSLLQRWDIEACGNTYICMQNHIDTIPSNIQALVVHFIYDQHGDEIVDYIISQIEIEDHDSKHSIHKELSSNFKEIHEEIDSVFSLPNSFLYRI